ncbi:matrix-remodeling-associated protein 5-like [Notothenia coriiceps]|uniref:Matrix-remodeling-associated protein 5-like n=1 Tax=Notothenia coriiceps TaxID=8208 RepID=A0A6I9PR62_9TELE|nr:PREDICTED: matrix-remodeling-associated protein 5-like [Notothenia coriiceps]
MGQACPRSCNCYQANEVHCTFRSLLSIPSGLPIHTRRINFGFNSISTIHDSSLAGLKKVELLMLHSNDLHHLPDEAFRDLKSLQILKLSYNKLREISSSLTFSGLTSLLRLYLDHNRLQHIHPRALLQLPSLRLLRLQGNRLHQLHPRTLCTLSLLNTYYFSTLRHLDLSNNSLTTLPRDTLATAPLLETLVLQANPWSCDCRMNWFLTWSLAHPGLMKCPGGPQCPICASPDSLQGQGLLEQTDPLCSSPVIASPGRDTPLETEHSEIQTSESFREPLGTASLGLSDQQGNSVDLVCNFTHSDSQDIAPPPDLSLSSSSPLPLALSLSLECPVERQSYETLWRILAYYSETAVRLERHIMLSKTPALAYRYRQAPETEGYYHTGVQSSVEARPQWLLQPAIGIQLNRAQSNRHKVQLIYSTRVSAHPDPASHLSASSPSSPPWVLISTNQTATELATVVGSKVELSCPLLSSGNPKVQWVQPDGSKLISPSSSLDGRLQASTSGLLIHKVQLSDAGIYYCIARAGKDVDVLPLRLAVEDSSFPPSGEQVGPPVTATVGKTISLSCKAFGSPAPHINWVLPDGNLVRQGLAVSGLHFPQGHSQLLAGQPRYELHYKKKKGLAIFDKRLLPLMKASLSMKQSPQLKLWKEAKMDTQVEMTDLMIQREIDLKDQGRKQKLKGHLLMRLIYKRKAFSISSTTTTTMITTSTTQSPRERPSIVNVDPRGRPNSGGSNQNRPTIDWRNPGTNSIPDSDSSRPQWPPSPSLPAAPGVPVVRSKPRIADPHIRTESVPAESTARLACEAQGEPKPSITWTKVSTGAVMSILSRAERFEVLPNGTLVIQNIQLQDRGTYICSAQSFLGRDRLLANLEVWTRPPRMQLASYREVTIHQGGEVHLQCQADGVPSPLLSWVLPDRSVLTSSAASTSRIIMDTNGTLHIPVTLTGDRGVYRCVASNSAGTASASARVHVSSLPPVIQQAKEEHLLLSPGRPVYAHCSARGAPTPTLRWRIPDGTIVRQSQFLHGNLFVLPNGTLHIRGVRPKDSGNYECIASNAVGTDKRTVRLEIEGSAEGERSQSEARHEGTKVVEKTSSSLNKDRTLSIPSHPSNPFNSARLPASSPHDRSRTLPLNPSSSRSSFYPRPPTATNSLPKIHKTVTAYPTHLSNINKTKLSPLSPSSTIPTNNTKVSPGIVNNTKVISPPPSKKYTASAALHPSPVSPFSKALIVSTSPSSSTVHYGLFLQLHCSVTGNPAPIIIWRTPISKLVDVHYSFDHRLKVHPNGTLSIRALTEKDAGDYLCIARNKVSDDYRRLRVSVVTKPAKIEPKQPLNQMVSFGTPLKVDCQASGLPDPSVRWSLPDGTMVNSVLQGEDRGGRTRRLTVFDNGTLLVPAVGMGEEGEYTCYAENQGGQDTMKVKVKIMRTSLPTFTDDRRHHVVNVREGATATIPCQATGVPAPTVTWFSPTRLVIPKSLGSGFYSERVVVVSGGILEVRLAQKIDTGTYTCRASNSAGERSMLVGLEVEAANHGQSGRVGGRGWSTSYQPDSGHGSRSGESTNNARIRQDGFTNADTGQLGSSDSRNNAYSANDGRTKNIAPKDGTNIATSGFYPALRSDSQDGLNRPVSGITTQLGRSDISVGVSGAGNTGIKADNIGTNQNGPGIMSNSNSLSSSHNTVGSDNVERNPGTNTNEVNAGKAGNGAYTSRENGRISVSNTGAGTGSLSGNVFSRSSSNAVIAAGTKNYSNTVVGVVTTVKQRAVKGQTVVLPCLSQGSPPPRVAWLLPGNGVLPAPYYGSRLTVHRNGSLELRGVRASDSGTLFCVVRNERGQTTIQVELEVSEPQKEARLSHRGRADERPVMGRVVVIEAPRPGASLDSAKSLSSRPVLPEALHPKIQVTQKPLHRGQSLPAIPRPVGPPPRSSSPVSEPAVSTRTAPLVSIVNGENLRLPCPAPQTHGYTQVSLSWTMPNGKVLTRGESDDSGRYKVQEDGILTVQQASVYDRGTFSCRSTSGNSVSVITVPVIVIAYPPRITTGPSPVTYTRPGVAVELPCRTIATPRATVTWETPDLTQLRVMSQARIYGNRYLSPQGSLVIQNPTSRDTGFYRCTAKNVIGVDTKATYLHVI